MIVRARYLVTMDGPPLEDGAVVVQGGRIVAVGPFREVERHERHERHCGSGGEEQRIDLGDRVLLPGLLNAHCHLDYTGLRGAIPPQDSFTRWIGCINALKRGLTEADYLQAIADGFAELERWGTTTVCNLAAFPGLLPKLPPPPLRVWWFPELLDIRDPSEAPRLVAESLAALDAVRGRPGWLGGFGLGPHAPYTASAALYRLCGEAATRTRPALPLTTHIAESADETAMFREGRGDLYALLARVGRAMDDCGHGSPFSTAVRAGWIGPGWLLAHANELEEADFELLARAPGPPAWHFVHCPCSHRYFGHKPFPWRRLEALGANICLGTDSLASNAELNLFAEMRAAQKSASGLTSENLLETVTTHPARALGKSGELGVLAPGAHADMIALPFDGPLHEIHDALVANRLPIEWMMLDGKLRPARA